MINRSLRRFWPNVKNDRILAIGYAPPVLGQFQQTAERVIAAMPARQGVIQWSGHAEDNQTLLVQDTQLPFPDVSMDKIILIHSLEMTENATPLLQECWRVLNNSGSLIVVVPNRRGIWARNDRTPFGHGAPYTRFQLDRVLRDHLFDPTHYERTLFTPPVHSRLILSFAPLFQRIGARFFPRFCGVIVMEAKKKLYAASISSKAKKGRTGRGIPAISSP